MKKFGVLFLALIVGLSLLAGCSQDGSGQGSTTAAAQQTQGGTTAGEAKRVNEFGWEIPEKTLEFTYFSAEMTDPQKAAENTVEFDKFLKEKFNVVIHKIVYNVNPTERLNLMLATGDYPDAIANLSVDQAMLFTAQNKSIDMKDLIDEYGETIKSQLGDLYIRYFNDKGEIHALPKYWGLLPIPDYSASIRYDYWLEAGSPEFSTPDEFYDVLLTLQKAHPTNANGQRTYALSDYGGGRAMWKMMTGAWGFKDEYREAPDKSLTHWMNTEDGLEIVKYVNKAYRDGQLDPDFSTNQFEQFMEKVSGHRVMGYIGSWWPCWTAGHMAWQKTEENWTNEMRFMNVQFKAPQAEAAYLTPKDLAGSQRAIITNKAKNPEDIIKWWNFEISEIGTKITGFGIPGHESSDWKLVDGISIWNDDAINGMSQGNYDQSGYDNETMCRQYWMVAGQQLLGNGDPRTGKWCNVWFDQNFNDLDFGKILLHKNMEGTIFDNSYRAVTFSPDNPLTVKNKQISDMLLTGWANMVTADSEAECEALFRQLQADLNKAGLKEIEAFRSEQYIKNIEKWGGK